MVQRAFPTVVYKLLLNNPGICFYGKLRGLFYSPFIYLSIAAAVFPAPIARITVAAPVKQPEKRISKRYRTFESIVFSDI